MAPPLTFAWSDASGRRNGPPIRRKESMARSMRLIAVAIVAVFALAMPAFAAQAKQAKTEKAKTVTLSGTLQKVDGQTLTVQTAKGSETVMLTPTAQIRRSGKSVAATDLGNESGSRVTIRYME